jgi:GNAT superfamily N-acetyltransferase
MHVRALQTTEEFERYAHFGHEVYRDNPYWVPHDAQFLVSLLSGESAHGPHSRVRAFWVEEDDRLRATLTVVVHELYNRHWDERMGHLLFFEALPGQDDAVQTLMQAACEWLRAHGCHAARLSILLGWQIPLTIDAYDAVPTVFHTYNPAYYHSYVKNAGFQTERGAVQYQIRFTPELADRYRQMVARAASEGVNVRSLDFDRLDAETALLIELYNETFAAHWGANPMTQPIMEGLTHGLKDFLIADFIRIAEVDGQAVGFVYALPDLNQAFHRLRGEVVEEHLTELQQYLQEIDHGVLLIIGVRPPYRGRGINLALAAQSYLAMIERGYTTASYTIVLDDNWPSRRTAEKLGGKVTRNYIVYRKELA